MPVLNLKRRIFPFLLFAVICTPAFGQLIPFNEASLRSEVEFLSDSTRCGRVTGSREAADAAFYIARQMRSCGLDVRVDSFLSGEKVGHNVEGLLLKPGCEKYVIVMAHYDGAGSKCPGADSNVSGVAALLALARGRDYSKLESNVIYVALDGHYDNSAGAARLLRSLEERGIKTRQISLVVNLDILGSTLVPPHKGAKNYLIALGADRRQELMSRCNFDIWMFVYTDYYGSRSFTDLFYRKASDHCPFLQKGVPCVMFTSGITLNTNRPSDTASELDYEVFCKRVRYINRWLENY